MSLQNKNSLACMFSHESDDWATPSELYNRFRDLLFFDPCPLHSSVDGLSISWEKYNFVNPPFSMISQFVEKAIKEVHKGNHVIMLLPVRTDTKWFERLNDVVLSIIFIKGRLHFNDSKNGAPFPCMLVALCDIPKCFISNFCIQTYDRLLQIDMMSFAEFGI